MGLEEAARGGDELGDWRRGGQGGEEVWRDGAGGQDGAVVFLLSFLGATCFIRGVGWA